MGQKSVRAANEEKSRETLEVHDDGCESAGWGSMDPKRTRAIRDGNVCGNGLAPCKACMWGRRGWCLSSTEADASGYSGRLQCPWRMNEGCRSGSDAVVLVAGADGFC